MIEKQFYPNEEDYEELEDTMRIFDWKDEEIRELKSDINMCLWMGIMFVIGIGLILVTITTILCK